MSFQGQNNKVRGSYIERDEHSSVEPAFDDWRTDRSNSSSSWAVSGSTDLGTRRARDGGHDAKVLRALRGWNERGQSLKRENGSYDVYSWHEDQKFIIHNLPGLEAGSRMSEILGQEPFFNSLGGS